MNRSCAATGLSPALVALAGALGLATGMARSVAAAEDSADVQLPQHLHMADALRLCREHGLELVLADAAVERARADALQADALPSPALSAGAARSFHCGTIADCSTLGWSTGISDQSAVFDVLSGKRRLRANVATLALQVARTERVQTLRDLEVRVRLAYLAAVAARQALAAQLEEQSALTNLTELNQARFQRGSISEVDMLSVETEKLNTDQEVEHAQGTLDAAKSDLAALLGVRQPKSYDVDSQLPAFAVPTILADASLDSLLAQARRQRSDLQAAEQERDRAQAALRSSQRLRFPDIALSAGVAGEGNGIALVNPVTLNFGVTLTPMMSTRYEAEIVKATADLRAKEAELALLERQILNDVETALAQWKSSRRRVERDQRELLARARRTRDLVLEQYQKGATSQLEFLDAERVFIASKLDYANDLADYWRAVVLLGQAIGEALGP